MAKLVVLAAAEKHEINLYKMTHQNKKQLASAIDELLKAERERNREGRPPTHFIFRELVWELVIILFKEHGRRTNWIGFNRAGENHKKRKRGQIYGPLFDSVKAAIGEVLGLKVAIDEDQAKAMKGQLALEQGASDNEDLEPCSEKDERPRFSDEAVAEIIRASLRDAKAQLENPSPWLPAELHTELSAALGNLVG
jgi:hypothetical protein